MNRYEGEREQRGQRRRENEYSSGNDVEIKDHGVGGNKENDERGKGEAGGGSCLFGWP